MQQKRSLMNPVKTKRNWHPLRHLFKDICIELTVRREKYLQMLVPQVVQHQMGADPYTVHCADPFPLKRFCPLGHSSYRRFTSSKKIALLIILSDKQKGCSCGNFLPLSQVQVHMGGIIAGTRQELPGRSSVTVSWMFVLQPWGLCSKTLHWRQYYSALSLMTCIVGKNAQVWKPHWTCSPT